MRIEFGKKDIKGTIEKHGIHVLDASFVEITANANELNNAAAFILTMPADCDIYLYIPKMQGGSFFVSYDGTLGTVSADNVADVYFEFGSNTAMLYSAIIDTMTSKERNWKGGGW